MLELILTEKIEFIDGSFVLVRAPNTYAALDINQYYLDFKREVQGKTLWLINNDAKLAELQQTVYAVYSGRIKQLAEMLHPGLEQRCDEMALDSRHRFFVASQPIDYENEKLPGLSGLDRLLGYSHKNTVIQKEHPEQEDDSAFIEQIIDSTGSHILDLIVDANLVFKGRADRLLKRHSPTEITNMLIYAGKRLKPPEEQLADKMESPIYRDVELPTESDGFKAKRDHVMAQLEGMGIEMPVD